MELTMQRETIQQAVNQRVWAIVGASNDRAKFGNRIYRDLRSAGYRVYPVNPNIEQVEGDRAYPSLQALPVKPEVADIVVPADVGVRIADDAREAGIRYFWLQPGAETDELIEYARSLGLQVIHHACAMAEKRMWQETESTGDTKTQ